MQPLAIAILVAAAAAVIFVVHLIQRSNLFRGYEDNKADVLQIVKLMRGDLERDDDDLLISGNYGRYPTIVRFSLSQNTPGMSLEMTVPATFDLSISPKALPDAKGRTAIKTGSAALDGWFSARSNQPMQARVFLDNSAARAQLEKLCCSNQTGVVMDTAVLELHELLIPRSTAVHVRDHLASMSAVAGLLEKMPGADVIQITPLPRQRNWTFRVVVAVGSIVIFASLFSQTVRGPSTISGNAAARVPAGLLPADATRIAHLDGWHVALESDLSPAAAQYLRDRRQPVGGRVTGHFGPAGGPPDSAYLFRDAQGRARVTIISGNLLAYDAVFPRIDLIAVVPRDYLGSIQWQMQPRVAPGSDVLLLVEDAENSGSGQVLFQQGRQIYTARAADFTKINFY